ncbi:PaaI family thioesterase [Stakelama pacifica]|uniref:Uncharacterized protein (TIGR00369 family) n=1 Tax=Stakelama pacifica TaxID=517720 RepID=A0A4R6FL53_9SPHN|nr:PaaI family thioesterase [Stakelama pacifica]MAW99030.1 phenylacetic acid degradation protein [Sphingomonas sp.]TDN82242.1 uncharacterized protein (TIGR00369 family) [Stakelama pacifica]GGO95870.1 hypothetical protein GCM10011329_21070 [Stakelama pacifica]
MVADSSTAPHFVYEDDPDLPGWKRWELGEAGRYNDFLGPLSVRMEGDVARVRMVPQHCHSNVSNNLHGGVLLGFVDVAMFAASRGFEVLTAGAGVTLDVSVQFLAAGSVASPVEAHVELLRETGRMLFLRGLVVQDSTTIGNFSGTLRKLSPR